MSRAVPTVGHCARWPVQILPRITLPLRRSLRAQTIGTPAEPHWGRHEYELLPGRTNRSRARRRRQDHHKIPSETLPTKQWFNPQWRSLFIPFRAIRAEWGRTRFRMSGRLRSATPASVNRGRPSGANHSRRIAPRLAPLAPGCSSLHESRCQ